MGDDPIGRWVKKFEVLSALIFFLISVLFVRVELVLQTTFVVGAASCAVLILVSMFVSVVASGTVDDDGSG